MEFKKGKWIRQSKAAAIFLLAGAMLLAIYGSFAAYTNFNSVKRVVSTGTQSDTMFGSNYLSLMNLSDTSIPVKRISLAESNGTYTFTDRFAIMCGAIRRCIIRKTLHTK